MNMQTKFERELFNRIIRIESKLVRGFEELGVNIDADNNWLSVDDPSREVYISTMGRSLSVMLTDMTRAGATQINKDYDIVFQGNVVGSVVYVKL